jgi:hypothetical protein
MRGSTIPLSASGCCARWSRTEAREVFAADKVARLRAAERDGLTLAPETLEHYRRSLQMLAGGRPRPRYADELADRLHHGMAGAPPLHDRGERLADAAQAAAAISVKLGKRDAGCSRAGPAGGG